jgi:putative N6-adenine-specific DNA methylase
VTRLPRVHLFLPAARGCEAMLARECAAILGRDEGVRADRAGVSVEGDALDTMRLNFESRLAQRVLWPLAEGAYRSEHDLYDLARSVAWRHWITPDQTLRVDTSAQRSPLASLNFASLRIKDAVCDQLREATGARPSVDTRDPHLAIQLHLTAHRAALYVDTSGEPLFKRGWRDVRLAGGRDHQAPTLTSFAAPQGGSPALGRPGGERAHGEAPLKETLAAAMLAAAGWQGEGTLLDPCCGAGTIVIEAAQIACGIAPGLHRRFAFERLAPWREHMAAWRDIKRDAQAGVHEPRGVVHASDIESRLVASTQANARRAGVDHAITITRADAMLRPPPPIIESATTPTIVTNPPFGHRIDAQGDAQGDNAAFAQGVASNWKKHYPGWTAWILCPDRDFESTLRLKASARVPLWNGTIECRLLKLQLQAGSMRGPRGEAPASS